MASRFSRLPSARMLLLPLAVALASVPAVAMAADASIDQVYATARGGDVAGALTMMDPVLKDHPNSAKAHFIEAELLSRSHRAADARAELAKADALAPGLPFVSPHSKAALRAALGYGGAAGPVSSGVAGAVAPAPVVVEQGSHIPWGAIIIIGLFVFALLAMARRRNAAQYGAPMGPGAYPPGYGPQGFGPQGPAPMGGYPQGYGPGYGGGMGMGGGMGGGLMGGLATGVGMGAGLAVGEEVVGHMFGGGRERLGDGGVAGGGWDQGGGDPNADMGGGDFGISDSGSWDSGSSGGDGGW